MNILAIETSVATGSVALQCGENVSQLEIETPRRHAEEIIPRIHDCLADQACTLQQLDALAFGRGPGSFIGVRLAAAVAQGLATAGGIGLAPVSSLAALALQAGSSLAPDATAALPIVVCLDARMGEVYLAQFSWQNGQLETQATEQLLRPAEVVLPSANAWLAVGSGFAQYRELCSMAQSANGQLSVDMQPQARDLLPFAQSAVAQEQLLAPATWRDDYLRDDSAWRRLD